MRRIMIITDSSANPRSFPINEKVALEQTYPYLLRRKFEDATFWQLSIGNVTSDFLLGQAIAYLSDWEPDWVVVHAGLVDCRPEAFSELQKQAIGSFGQRVLRQHIYNPKWIKWRQIERVTEKKFRSTVQKLGFLFSQSKISWLEIGAGLGYEEIRPGVMERCLTFNNILNANLKLGCLPITNDLREQGGFNSDHLHLNCLGHKIITEKLLEN